MGDRGPVPASALCQRLGIIRSPDGAFSYADYVKAALAAGRTENGTDLFGTCCTTLLVVPDSLIRSWFGPPSRAELLRPGPS